MIWRSLMFDSPAAALLLLLILPLGILFYLLYHWRRERISGFAAIEVVRQVMTGQSNALYWVKALLLTIAFALAVIALAQPKGNAHYGAEQNQLAPLPPPKGTGTMRKKMHDVILLIDASASMAVKDSEGGKSRLETAKEIADQVIASLRGETVALYPFTSVAIRAVPSTMDYFFTRLMLNQLTINEGETTGTSIKNALDAIRERYLTEPSPSTKTVILFSDGGDTLLYGLSGERKNEAIQTIIAPINASKDPDFAIYAIGIGSTRGATIPNVSYQGKAVESSLDSALLKRIALAGHGAYITPSDSSVFRVAQDISRQIAKRGEYIDVSVELPMNALQNDSLVYDLFFQFPLAAALIALLLALVLPDTLRKKSKDAASQENRIAGVS